MSDVDPYHASTGPEIDPMVHREIPKHGAPEVTPAYPFEERGARELEPSLRKIATAKIVAGFEDDPGTTTVAWAETYPLPIRRLALLCRGKLRVGEKHTLYSGALSGFQEWYAGH